MEDDRNVQGTQAIDRSVRLLRLIARFEVVGARLTDLVALSGMKQPTVRRMLKALIDAELVSQSSDSKRYMIGPLPFELGLASPNLSHRLVGRYRPMLDRLAQQSGDTIYLIMRSGYDSLCVTRVEGTYPIKMLLLAVGGRRPLGVGAASQALLAALPDDEVERVLSLNESELSYYGGLTAHQLREEILQTRRRGYSLNESALVLGVSAIGMAIPNHDGQPLAAVSISALSSRISGERTLELAALLAREIRALSD